jgi:hypothetical protein
MTGHRSVYPSQILSMKKSASLHVTIGEEMEDVKTRYVPHEKSLSGAIIRIFQQAGKAFNKTFSSTKQGKDDNTTAN